jgi:hypothetical protein
LEAQAPKGCLTTFCGTLQTDPSALGRPIDSNFIRWDFHDLKTSRQAFPSMPSRSSNIYQCRSQQCERTENLFWLQLMRRWAWPHQSNMSEVLESFEIISCGWMAPGPTSRDSGEARAKLCQRKPTHPWSARLDLGVLSTNTRQTMGPDIVFIIFKIPHRTKDLIRVMRWMRHCWSYRPRSPRRRMKCWVPLFLKLFRSIALPPNDTWFYYSSEGH